VAAADRLDVRIEQVVVVGDSIRETLAGVYAAARA
jgi:beta-phosphoglucomutase-like phosphatase (HAD superfamily)